VTKRPRAVFDTNVFVSSSLSKNVNSPTRELLQRWKNNEFTLLICDQIVKELLEILNKRGMALEDITEQVTLLARSAEWVEVPEERIENLLSDPDDNVVIACAVEGGANYLVTYDPHFDLLKGDYKGIKIVKAIPFLEVLRENDE
jgi:putative PIN family toxin of toxin-antitoxin system